jgi:pantoate--beta-alanine ligase
MGALHQGHLSLIELASRHSDRVLASIFVNPAQFNRSEDLENYPRTEDRDVEMLGQSPCHAVFIPSVSEVYGDPASEQPPVHYELGALENALEGAHRPGHFQGVARILDLFFTRIAPDFAFFGEKDFQQLAVVRKLVEIENHKLKIVGGATHREADGLAMSSRNMRLSPQGREQAPQIYATLKALAQSIDPSNYQEELETARRRLDAFGELETEYLELADSSNFSMYEGQPDLKSGRWRLFAAVYASGIRLIDNLEI